MLIKNIKWDTDGDMEALASLPTEVTRLRFWNVETMIWIRTLTMSLIGFRMNMGGAISGSRP